MSVKAKLFSEKLKNMRVVALRMITGEEILTRVKETKEDHVVIDQPRVLLAQLQQKPDGTPFMAAQILNWLNSNPDADTVVCYDDVVAICTPDEAMEKEYIRFTTSIELAGAGSLIK